MKENNTTKNKIINRTARENPSKIKNEEIPHRIMKISEFLKAKKKANFDLDLSSVSKKTYTTLIGDPLKNKNNQKKKEEEIKTSNIQNNETQKKNENTRVKIPEYRRRKYRLRTNETKLPSNIDLLKNLNDNMEKNKKQPIFKFEEEENNNNNNKNNNNNNNKNNNNNNKNNNNSNNINTNINRNNYNNNNKNINNNDEDSEKNKVNYTRKNCYRHKKTSSQTLVIPKVQNYEKRIAEVLSRKDKLKPNATSKNLTYVGNIRGNNNNKNKDTKNTTQNQTKYRNYNYNKNQNQNIEKNENAENEIVKNSYFMKLKALFIEFSFLENMNAQFEDAMEDKSKSIINFNNNPNEIILEIFDGHGGEKISTYLQQNFSKIYKKFLEETQKNISKSLSLAFSKLDNVIRELPNIEDQGSTGTVIHIIREKNNRLFIYNGNAGDSRATLISPKKILRISKDHRASDKEEKKRILKEGGLVFHGRVNGELMLTRSFGDFAFKQTGKNSTKLKKTASTGEIGRFRKGVIVEPFVTQIEIDQSIDNQFLFLASDGIWDVISEEEVQEMIKVNSDTQYLSSLIIEKALIKQAWDNLSIFVVKLT